MRLLFMRCPPFSSTMSKMLKNKWKMILIFPCMSNLFWTIFTLLWLCCFTLTSFSDLAHCACIYVRHQKKFLNWPTQMTISNYRWVLSKGLGTSCEFFFLCIFGKRMELFITKKHTMDFQKTPHYNALLLQFSAVFCLVILEFSDSFVRLKQNQQTDESD